MSRNQPLWIRAAACLTLMLFLLPAAGCASGKQGASVPGNADSGSSVGAFGGVRLTREQMLADYDAMWKDIEENYPLMGVAERTTGEDFTRVQEEYRDRVAEAETNEDFFSALNECIGKFTGCGHCSLLDADNYAYDLSVYGSLSERDPHFAYLYGVLNNPKSKEFYRYAPGVVSGAPAPAAPPRSNNIETSMLREGRTAYVKLSTFASENVEHDAPILAVFFKKASGCADCVIDIRGNGGGAENYWISNIVRPNLKNVVSYTEYELLRGEASKEYLEQTDSLFPVSEFPNFPKTNADDLATMRYYTRGTVEFRPEGPKPVFAGKFYLLTDQKVYSSSEGFAIFCKQTGFATIVGDTTGGDGVGFDPILFSLPNSGVCFRFSASLGLNPDGSSNEEFGTLPDVPCESGKDALQTCLDLIEKNAGCEKSGGSSAEFT